MALLADSRQPVALERVALPPTCEDMSAKTSKAARRWTRAQAREFLALARQEAAGTLTPAAAARLAALQRARDMAPAADLACQRRHDQKLARLAKALKAKLAKLAK